jgi:hypothetical protein
VAVAVAVIVRANDVDAAVLVGAEVVSGIEIVEGKRAQPVHRFFPGLGVE